MTEMIEKVARAILGTSDKSLLSWEYMSERAREPFLDQARAAIAAMREHFAATNRPLTARMIEQELEIDAALKDEGFGG